MLTYADVCGRMLTFAGADKTVVRREFPQFQFLDDDAKDAKNGEGGEGGGGGGGGGGGDS
jgi:hypothetical protein